MPSGFWSNFSHTLVSLLPCQLKYNVFGFVCKWAGKKDSHAAWSSDRLGHVTCP